MRVRSKVLVSLGIAALAMGSVAGGAFAHGGHGKNMGKNLKVDVRGEVTAVTPTSVTIDPDGAAGPLAAWTCTVKAGAPAPTAVVGDKVRAKCADDGAGALVIKRLRTRGDHHGNSGKGSHSNGGNSAGKVEVEARGVVTAFAQDAVTGDGEIVVNPGTGLPTVTCTLKTRTRVLGTPAVGDTVKIKCKSRDGQLVAKKIKENGLIAPGQVKVEVKGPVTAVALGSITIAGITCTTTPTQDAALAAAGIVVGVTAEAHCSGTPFALVNAHLED